MEPDTVFPLFLIAMTSPRLMGSALRSLGRAVLKTASDYARNTPQTRRMLRSRLAAGAVIVLLPAAGAWALWKTVPQDSAPLESYQRTAYIPIRMPDLRHQVASITIADEPVVRSGFTQHADTLTSLMARLGIRDTEAFRFIETNPDARGLVSPAEGNFVMASIRADGRLETLDLYTDGSDETAGRVLNIARNPAGKLTAEIKPFRYEVQQNLASGRVEDNPQASLTRAGIPKNIVSQMHDAFDFDRDIVSELVPGDTWRLIYETKYAQGNFVRYGKLLAMALDHKGKTTELFWFGNDGKGGHYYDARGHIAKRVFMRVPLDIKSVSSEFAPLRCHPITGIVRPHQGTDFRAPWGATVRAAADGVVVFAGVGTGYGNYIRLQHGPEYQTVYAHLSSITKGLRKGDTVKYGEIIGKVGQTGLATGPHLHYELKVDGVQINPMTANLPDQPVLTPYQIAQMEVRSIPLQKKLAMLEGVQAASAKASAQKSSDEKAAGH